MSDAAQATTWAGVASLLIINLAGFGKQWLDSRKLGDVHSQVQNSHGGKSNLREDIDEIKDTVSGLAERLDEHIKNCPQTNPPAG